MNLVSGISVIFCMYTIEFVYTLGDHVFGSLILYLVIIAMVNSENYVQSFLICIICDKYDSRLQNAGH